MKSMMLEASMVRKGTKAMRRSSRKKEEAKDINHAKKKVDKKK